MRARPSYAGAYSEKPIFEPRTDTTSTSPRGGKLKYSYVLTKILDQGNGVREKLTRSKVVSTVENVILRHIGRNFSVFGGVV